jgi:succinoglycan biosynthesis protein ExoA
MKPYVSVIIPCRNEAAFLGRCLDSILAGTYPAERMEVLVADGMSGDGTRELIARYAARDGRVRGIDNPRRITPAAINRGIGAARGGFIVRLDARATVAPDYISRAVETLDASGADNAGGAIETVAEDTGIFAGPIVAALTHPFGVGNSHFRTGVAAPRWVDTVFGGCWRREVFDRIGTFNERLERGQDLEFNLRLRQAGGKILLAPELMIRYHARATLGAFLRHNWTNGVWAVLPLAYSRVLPIRWRHLAPLSLVIAIAYSPWAAAVYAAANLAASAHVAWSKRQGRYLALMPVAFASLHLAYGAGSLWGLFRLARQVGNLRRVCNPPVAPIDYSSVTEQPSQPATRTQLAMLGTRYGWAASHARHKDVLEVACGAGLGLGWLASAARWVEAGDLDLANCRLARAACAGHPNLRAQPMDAMSLPFADGLFDLVLLFEALYYLRDAEGFFREARRVLRSRGTLLVATVNREWRGFHPSPFSTRYLSAAELEEALRASGFETRLLAGFPERSNWVGQVRRAAVALGWMPGTMAGKVFLKRLFYGPLEPIPSQLAPCGFKPEAMTAVGQDIDLRSYRVLYAEATNRGGNARATGFR